MRRENGIKMKDRQTLVKKIFFSLLVFFISRTCSIFLYLTWFCFSFDKTHIWGTLKFVTISTLETIFYIKEFLDVPLDVFNGLNRDMRFEYLLSLFLFILLLIGIIWGLKRYFKEMNSFKNIYKLWPFFIAIFIWSTWGIIIGIDIAIGGV